MFAVPLFIKKYLGSEVFGGTAEGVGKLIVGKIGLGETEIAQRDVARCVKQNVLWLEITGRFSFGMIELWS